MGVRPGPMINSACRKSDSDLRGLTRLNYESNSNETLFHMQ